MDTKDKNQEQDIESYPQNGINLGKPKKESKKHKRK